MTKLIKSFLLNTAICISILLMSCSDSGPVNPPGNTTVTVNGKAINVSGENIKDIRVIIDGKEDTTDLSGSFSISNVTIPYDVIMISDPLKIAVVYKGLSSVTPKLFAPFSNTSHQSITVKIPALVSGISRAKVFFADTLTGYINGSSDIPLGDNSATIDLKGSTGTNVFGKVFYIEYTMVNNLPVSYTKYAEKYISTTIGSITTVTFLTSDISDPGESTVSGTVTAPSGSPQPLITLALNSGPFNNYLNPGAGIANVTGNTFNFNVPTGTPSPIKINVAAFANGFSNLRMSTIPAGGSGYAINIDPLPDLSTPANNSTNIDTTTLFSWTSSTGGGMYEAWISGPNTAYYIFTKDLNTKIPNLSKYGFPLPSITQYSWNITKVLDFYSMDDIVNLPILVNPNYKASQSTGLWTFTTKP